MKTNINKSSSLGGKYDALSVFIVILAVVLIIAICIWFDYQNSQLENELVKFK